MDRKEIFEQMNDIFRDVLDNDEIVLIDSITAEDIDEWDSLAHVQLIERIEAVFGVKISAKEMMSCDNIGGLITIIQEKLT